MDLSGFLYEEINDIILWNVDSTNVIYCNIYDIWSEYSQTQISGEFYLPIDNNYIGHYNVSVYSNISESWVSLDSAIEVFAPPQITNIYPNAVTSGSGNQQFEITISNLPQSLYDDFQIWENFVVTSWDWIWFDVVEITSDSTLMISLIIPNIEPQILNYWSIYGYFEGGEQNSVSINNIQPVGLEILAPPCGTTYMINDYDAYICEQGTKEINIYSQWNVPLETLNNLSIQWSNGQTNTNSIIVDSPGVYSVEISLDTLLCFSDSINIDLIPTENIYSVEIVPPTCFGVNDGAVTILPSDNVNIDLYDTDCFSSEIFNFWNPFSNCILNDNDWIPTHLMVLGPVNLQLH